MIREGTFAPGGLKACQAGIAKATPGDPLVILPDRERSGGHLLVDKAGECLGRLTERHWVSAEITAGRKVLHASVNGAGGGPGADGFRSITVRVATGDAGDKFSMPPPATPRVYSVNVAGESHRQEEIARTRVGETVRLRPDPTNPHDERAVAVLTWRGDQIGFLPRDGWLTDVILDEGREVHATVAKIAKPCGGRPHAAVILKVILL